MQIESIYACVAALDVHLNKIVVCIIRTVAPGKDEVIVKTFGGFKRDRRAMAEWIASFHPQAVAMESTGIYWKSPYAALERIGIRAKVVNAYHVAKVEGRKTDINDAQWLAMLIRAGLVRGSFIPHETVRHLRLVARYHSRLTRQLAAEKNRLVRVLGDGGLRLTALVSDPHGKASRQMIDQILDGASPQQAVRLAGRLKADRQELAASLDHELTSIHVQVAKFMREHIDYLQQLCAELEQQLYSQLQPYQPLMDLWLTMPGIDRLAAAKLLVEIGPEMELFGNSGRLAVWAGVCPGNDQTADKRKNAKTRKGNAYVRTLLIEIANAAVKTRCYFQQKYRSLRARKGHKLSIVAIAHKLIRVVYLLTTRQVPYRDDTVNMEEMYVKKCAPRWIKALKKYGLV